ncbi:MAG TPA: RNA polymerase sigma factor [Spirochaetota bacterium]|nr:RNA polymerase sigma factor [Spirochaetota bacterium]
MKIDLRKLRNRDADEFELLYREYGRKIYAYLLLKTRGNADLANDILHDTFCSAIESAGNIKNDANLGGWLFCIAQRRLVDQIRRNTLQSNFINLHTQEDLIENDIEKELLDREKKILINTAIEDLSDEYRKILSLKYFENRSQREIAEIMEKSEGAVESMLFRARQALKNILKNDYETLEVR